MQKLLNHILRNLANEVMNNGPEVMEEDLDKNRTKVYERQGKLGIVHAGIYRVMGCAVDRTVISIIDMGNNSKVLLPTLSIPTLVALHQDDIILITEDGDNVVIYKYTNAKFVYSLINNRLLDYPRLVPAFEIAAEDEAAYAKFQQDYTANIRMAAKHGYPVGSEYVKVVTTATYGSNTIFVVDESVREREEQREKLREQSGAQQRKRYTRPTRKRCEDKSKCDGCPVKDIIKMFE